MAAAAVLTRNSIERSYHLPADYVSLPSGYHPKPDRFVGLLMCQMNPTLRSFDTIITRIDKRKLAGSNATNSRKRGTRRNAEPSTCESTKWEIECQDTVIFPEGGGQPCDHGILTLRESPNGVRATVKEAFRQDLAAIHIVQFPSDFDPLTNGWILGAKVHMEVDWDRRTYHMQQHTGQHLLSAIFENELKNDTLGWMLSQNSQPSYVDLQRLPSVSDIEYVARRCNEVIQSGSFNVRIEIRLQSEHEQPGTLPEDYRNGVIRYVIIDKLDKNPCCGTHHPSIASLGSVFIFPGVTNISGPTRYRIFFAVGYVVLQHFARTHSILKEVGAALDCGQNDITDRLATLQKSRKEGLRREKNLRIDALRALSNDLNLSFQNNNHGIRVGFLHREDENTDVDFMNQIISGVSLPEKREVDHQWIIAICSGPINLNAGAGGCLLIVGSDDALVKRMGDAVKEKLGARVKGGGRNARWQGKVIGNWKVAELTELRQLLDELTQ